jgi:hypothetical protein
MSFSQVDRHTVGVRRSVLDNFEKLLVAHEKVEFFVAVEPVFETDSSFE